MRNLKMSGALILALSLLLAGCGKTAYFIRPGTTTVNQKDTKMMLAVPDKDGNLVPGVEAIVPVGALIRVAPDRLPEKAGE